MKNKLHKETMMSYKTANNCSCFILSRFCIELLSCRLSSNLALIIFCISSLLLISSNLIAFLMGNLIAAHLLFNLKTDLLLDYTNKFVSKADETNSAALNNGKNDFQLHFINSQLNGSDLLQRFSSSVFSPFLWMDIGND